CGSKMLGTGLSRGAAMHNPATRRTPTRRTITPATRPIIARRSALCIVVPILIKHSLYGLPLTSRYNLDSARPIQAQEFCEACSPDCLASDPCNSVSSQLQGEAEPQAASIECFADGQSKSHKSSPCFRVLRLTKPSRICRIFRGRHEDPFEFEFPESSLL